MVRSRCRRAGSGGAGHRRDSCALRPLGPGARIRGPLPGAPLAGRRGAPVAPGDPQPPPGGNALADGWDVRRGFGRDRAVRPPAGARRRPSGPRACPPRSQLRGVHITLTSRVTAVRTIDWRGGRILIIDQTALPEREEVIEVVTVEELVHAIQRLAVRGAPALGVAGALGVALAAGEAERERW